MKADIARCSFLYGRLNSLLEYRLCDGAHPCLAWLADTAVRRGAGARDFPVTLGNFLPCPKAVLGVSAYTKTNIPAVNAVAMNETIHDFGGFPQFLFDQRYPAPGDAALADGRIDDLLNYRRPAPQAPRNHPTQEHLMPLFAALGAGRLHAASLHPSLTFSVLRMDAFEFAD